MAWFCSWRTLCTTGCLMTALLLGGSARGISFSAIEVSQPDWTPKPPFASPLAVSPNGDRVAGLIAYRDIMYDCGSYLGCSPAFSWNLPLGTQLPGEEMGHWGTLPAAAEQAVHLGSNHSLFNTHVGPLLVAASDGSTAIKSLPREFLVSYAMTNDGTTVVGSSFSFETGDRKPFRWSVQNGLQYIATPEGVSGTYATVVADDGAVIAGRGFRWTELEGAISVPDFYPEGISSDGSRMVGYSPDYANSLPLSWDVDRGTEPLELPSGAKGGAAFDLTANGRFAVGQVNIGSDPVPFDGLYGGLLLPTTNLIFLDPSATALTHQAVLWDAAGNVHNLQTWLTTNHDLGDQLTGWSLISANAISADGRVIAGVGINPEGHFQGWVVDLGPAVVVPEPAASVMLLASISPIIVGWTLTRRLG